MRWHRRLLVIAIAEWIAPIFAIEVIIANVGRRHRRGVGIACSLDDFRQILEGLLPCWRSPKGARSWIRTDMLPRSTGMLPRNKAFELARNTLHLIDVLLI